MKKALIALAILSTTAAISQVVAPEPKLKIEVTRAEAQTIIKALSKLPYDESVEVINSIIVQANRQLADTTTKKK
jgi:hypothetical protein